MSNLDGLCREQSRVAATPEGEGTIASACTHCQHLCEDKRKALPVPMGGTVVLGIVVSLEHWGLHPLFSSIIRKLSIARTTLSLRLKKKIIHWLL